MLTVALTIVMGQLTAQQVAENFLAENPNAEKLHAAYIEFINRGDDASRAERDFLQSIDDPSTRKLFAETATRMGEDKALAEVRNTFFDFLANDPEARALAERIYESRTRNGITTGEAAQGYHHLRKNLHEAAGLLDDKAKNRPAPVQALVEQLDQTPGARESLKQSFKHLANKPGAAEALTPYWNKAASDPAANSWETRLSTDTALWRKAFTRDILLAANADVREGVSQLHKIVGDNPEIADTYLRHVRELSKDPTKREGILRAWQERHGYRPAFPKAENRNTSNLNPKSSSNRRLPRNPTPPRSSLRKPTPPRIPGAQRRAPGAQRRAPGAARHTVTRPTPPKKPIAPTAPQSRGESQ